MKDEQFVVYCGWARNLLASHNIKSAESILIYCYIFTLSQGGEPENCYYGSRETLADMFCISKKTVDRILCGLTDARLIYKEDSGRKGNQTFRYRVNFSMINRGGQNDAHGGQNVSLGSQNVSLKGDKMTPMGDKMSPNNKANNKGLIYKEKNKERDNAPAHSCEDDEQTQRLIAAAMEPTDIHHSTYSHEVPTAEEVEHALRNMTVRPPEDEISLCAGYFIDRMEREEWKTRDWRNALRRYAQRWIVRGNAGRQMKKEAAKPTPPAEWTPDSEPTPFQIMPIELGGTLEKNEENLRRYLDAEVLDWEAEHGHRVSWRQADDWKEQLFAPLYRRIEKERKHK